MKKKSFGYPLRAIALALSGCIFAAAHGEPASAYPSRPIHVIVPFPAGAGTDILARVISAEMSADLKQPIIVENRPGASAIIGTEAVAKAPADGYTLLIASNNHAINPALFRRLPFDPVKSFTPVGELAVLPFVLVVNPSFPAKTLQDVVDIARSKPDQISYATTGNGTPPHVAAATLSTLEGVRMQHVPFKGSSEALTAVIGGMVPMMFANTLSVLPYVRAGKLRAIAVGSPRRIPQLPDVPTARESGLAHFNIHLWAGFLAPAGTPKDIVAKLNAESARVLALPRVKEQLANQGAESHPSTPEQFGAFVASEIKRLGQVARANDMHLD